MSKPCPTKAISIEASLERGGGVPWASMPYEHFNERASSPPGSSSIEAQTSKHPATGFCCSGPDSSGFFHLLKPPRKKESLKTNFPVVIDSLEEKKARENKTHILKQIKGSHVNGLAWCGPLELSRPKGRSNDRSSNQLGFPSEKGRPGRTKPKVKPFWGNDFGPVSLPVDHCLTCTCCCCFLVRLAEGADYNKRKELTLRIVL